MIRVDEDNKVIYFSGVCRIAVIEREFLRQTGKKRWQWRAYSLVPVEEGAPMGLQTGMPYTPPEYTAPGFEYSKRVK